MFQELCIPAYVLNLNAYSPLYRSKLRGLEIIRIQTPNNKPEIHLSYEVFEQIGKRYIYIDPSESVLFGIGKKEA